MQMQTQMGHKDGAWHLVSVQKIYTGRMNEFELLELQ